MPTKSTGSFGAWIRTLREERRLTVEALAKAAKISKQYLSVIERGEPHTLTGKVVRPSVGIVEKLAKALKVDINEARLAAGYAPNQPQESHDILDIATVMFHDADRLTPEEKEELLKTVRRVAAGMISEHGRE